MIKRFAERFDGASAFSKLPPEIQIEIGGLALEIVLAWNGQDAYEDPNRTRPFHAVEPILFDQLQDAAEELTPIPPRPRHSAGSSSARTGLRSLRMLGGRRLRRWLFLGGSEFVLDLRSRGQGWRPGSDKQ